MARPSASSRHADLSQRGLAAARQGDLALAATLLRKAAEARPRQAGNWINLAVVRLQLDDFDAAAAALSKALRAELTNVTAAQRLSALLKRFRLQDYASLDPFGLKAAFAFPDLDRQPIATSALAKLKGEGLAQPLKQGRDKGWTEAARALVLDKTALPLRDDLLLAALRHGLNTEPDIERLLSAVRRVLLLELGRERFGDKALVSFAVALIAHGLNSDYVLPVSGEERDTLSGLQIDRDALLAGDVAQAQMLLLLSLYQPFEATLDSSPEPKACSRIALAPLRELVQARAAELNAEAALTDAIPSLGAIADATSRRVAGQYEASPYPRWQSLATPPAGAAKRTLLRFFPEEKLGFMDQPFDVLIAGAGTGQHAIGSALAYRPNAHLLAIDLSRRSLAYAKRMAERYDAGHLDFAQADILDLDALDRRFDIIEAVGVLHHMAEPFAGWRALLDRLKPGGLMLVGLYSAVSRKVLSELREDPAYPGPGCSDDTARDFRQLLMARAPGEPGAELMLSEDFYALNAFRDLVLHESEMQLTLPEIAAFLAETGLAFRGFALAPERWDAFAQRFPDDPFPGSLDNWWAYEQDNPRLFDGMYVFWCEKAG